MLKSMAKFTETGFVKIDGREYLWKALNRLSFENDKCTNCGICCRSGAPTIFSEEEIKIKSLRSDLAVEPLDGKHFQPKMGKKTDGDCIFLAPNNQCEIYNIRPKMCKKYPLQIAFFPKYIEVWASQECPTANNGVEIPEREVVEAIISTASPGSNVIKQATNVLTSFEELALKELGPKQDYVKRVLRANRRIFSSF